MRVDVTLTGTISVAPDQFCDEKGDHFDHPEGVSIEFQDGEAGFTYQLHFTAVRTAEQQPDGRIEVVYQTPGGDDTETTTEVVRPGFQITTVTS